MRRLNRALILLVIRSIIAIITHSLFPIAPVIWEGQHYFSFIFLSKIAEWQSKAS